MNMSSDHDPAHLALEEAIKNEMEDGNTQGHLYVELVVQISAQLSVTPDTIFF